MTLRDALRVIGRWKWLILLFVVAITASAYGFSSTRTPQYTAQTRIKYEQQGDISNLLGDTANPSSYQVTLELQSVASVVASPEISAKVAAAVGLSDSKQLNVKSSVVANTSVVQLSVTNPDPQRAAAIANAYAAQFIDSNKQIERQRLVQAELVTRNKLRAFAGPGLKTLPDYIILEQRLRDLQSAAATVTGNYRVIAVAVPPSAPLSPKPRRDGALGLAVGLLGGVALAFLLEQLGTGLRSRREVAEAVRLPVVGRVPRIAKHTLKKSALVVVHEPGGSAAESLRALRSNLDFLSVDQQLSSIMVTSCLQGEGKSVTVCNLAITLAMGGRKVVVIDGDLRRPKLHEYFGMSNSVGLSSVVTGKVKLLDALQPYALPPLDWSSNGDGTEAGAGTEAAAAAAADTGGRPIGEASQDRKLYVLTSGPLPPNPGEMIASKRLEVIIRELEDSVVDLVLIDTPAFMPVSDAAAMAARVDGVFLIVHMESITRPMLAEAREFLDRLPCRKLGVIVVREKVERGDYHRYRYYKEGEKAKA